MNTKTLLIAIIAGLACTFAVFSALRAGFAAFPLLALSAMPIYIAALGWGTHVGVGASVVAILSAGAFLSPQAAVAIGLSITIPASIIGHQANLAQQNEDGTMEWYPLSKLLFNLAIILAVAITGIGYIAGYTGGQGLPELNRAIDTYMQQYPPPTPLTDAELQAITNSVFRLMPFVASGMWLIVHIVNVQLAAIVCRTSGNMPRPKDDIPASADMPRAGLVVLVASLLAASFLSGGLQLVAIVFAGTFVMAYAMVGLASLHRRARANVPSFILLILSYLLIVLFLLPLYLFAISGVIRSFSKNQNYPPARGPNSS